MIDPKGPLPRATYLRRRALAVAAAVVGVVLVAWVITLLLGGDEEAPQVRGMAGRPTSAPPSTPASSPPSESSAPSTTAAPPSPAAPAPDPAQPCPDAAMAVTAEVEAPSYRVGQKPALRLVVINSGAVPCTRDVGRALRELVVTSADGAVRLWSNNDCARVVGEQAQVIKPGERLAFEVSWAGRTSEPGCPVARKTVPAGDYRVVPRLGTIAGPPVALKLVA